MKKFLKIIKQVIKKMLGFYLIGAIIIFFLIVMPELTENSLSLKELFVTMPIGIIVSLLISFFAVTFFAGPFVSYYIMIKLGSNLVDSIEESEQKSIDNNIYYREVPKDYNPAIASLILNKWFERKTDITAMILYLIKRSYLKKDGDVISYTGKDVSNLSESEKYIIGCYSQSNSEFDFVKWKNVVIQEAKDKGYIEQRSEISIENIKGKIFKIATVIAVSMICSNLFSENILVMLILSILNSLLPFGIIVILIIIFRRSQINVKLTKKGIEEQEKLVKLRNFLNDFSLLEKSDDTSMILWEDYLIYAISLGVNTDIVEKSKIYEKMNCDNFCINQQIVSELLTKNKDIPDSAI